MEYAGETQVIHESVEGFAAGAVDAGIVLMTLTTAARALGLGALMIGGIRNDPQTADRPAGTPYQFSVCGMLHRALCDRTATQTPVWQYPPPAMTKSGTAYPTRQPWMHTTLN